MSRRNGFTLVELVVVVLILGILAAVAAPKILTSTSDAEDSGIAQTLANIRDAIELYKADPDNGGYPQTAGATTVADKLDSYLRGSVFPKVLVGGCTGNQILIDNDGTLTVDQTDTNDGWVFDENTGEIIINSDTLLSDGSGIKYSEL